MSDLNKYWATREMMRQGESREDPDADRPMLIVLRLLSDRPLPVSELLRRSRLDVTEFARVLGHLEGSGLAELRDEGGVQVAVQRSRK